MDRKLKINGSNQVYGVVDPEVTDVVIPDGVVSIKPKSFKGCKKLKTVSIPDSVDSIGASAFEGCSSLKAVVLPDSLETIEANLFARCSSLQKVHIQGNVTKIAPTAFDECKNIDEFTVTADNGKFCSVDGVIYNKRKTILHKVPSNIRKDEFVIDRKVKKVEAGAFQYCRNIKRIILPDGITKFHRQTFEGCTSLKCVNIPEGIEMLPNNLFCGCSSLKTITFPDSLEVIEYSAFEGCTSLRSISLSANFHLLFMGALNGCDSLERIDVDPANSRYTSIDGILYSKDMKQIIHFPSSYSESVFAVPQTVSQLGRGTFANCKNLQKLHIPNYTTVAENVISKCPALTAIHIHIQDIKVAPIDKNAFHGVYTSLCTLFVPKGCADAYRKHSAFASFANIQEEDQDDSDNTLVDMVEISADGKNLITVKSEFKSYITHYDIPEGVITIRESAFEGCRALELISFSNTVQTIQARAFLGCSSLKQLTLPCSLREIQNYAFSECGSITSEFLPEGVRRIGIDIIKNAPVTEIHIPSSVKKIAPDAFKGCKNLSQIIVASDNPYFTSYDGVLYNKDMTALISVPCKTDIKDFKIPDSVLSVSEEAFHNCNGIKSIKLNDFLETFPISIFTDDLTNLDSIIVSAESKMFQEKEGVLFSKDGKELIKMPHKAQVQDYVIPDGVKQIYDYAFRGCGELQAVTIPESVTIIGYDIFEDCKELTTMKLLCTIFDFGWYAFDGVDEKKCKVYAPEESFVYGFKGTAIEKFDVYSLKELEADADSKSGVTVEVNVGEKGYASKLGKNVKITGKFNLEDVENISTRIYDYLDVSEAQFGSQMEEWSQFLGISHSGPVYGNSGIREVDILQRFISSVKVATLVLPDDVQRRHINAAKKNTYIKKLIVRDSCELFSYVDGKLMNKKKTMIAFER